jgi:hypothetical protein
MFKTLHNTFISFSIIFQGFRRQHPKYKGGNVKGFDDHMILDEEAFWIRTNQGILLV